MLNQTIQLPKDLPPRQEQILVNVTPQETRVAVLEDDIVHELHIERSISLGLVSNIYLGQVKRVLPGMQSAFIDIGLERAAFLHVADLLEQMQSPIEEQRIEHLIFEGQTILVQVKKDPIGSKGARLSTQISLAGRFLVYLPQSNHIGISQKIEIDEDRQRLKARLEQLIPNNQASGYIIRTRAEYASDDELQADIIYLGKHWANIQQQARLNPAPSLLYQDLPLHLRIFRDMVSSQTERIIVDSTQSHSEMLNFAAQYVTNSVSKIELHTEKNHLFESYKIENEIEKAIQSRVNLKAGGYLIIEQTEAMATIDVNTGGFIGNQNFSETIFKTNLEAIQAIARQIRLRNMGGIIIVDFIDMSLEEHQSTILNELAKALSYDRTRVTLSGFTSLGLVEITRKRTRDNLTQTLCETCPTCRGRSHIKTAQTICYEIQREILREAQQNEAKSLRVLASQNVIDMFLDEEAKTLAMLSNFINKPISLAVENTYNQEQFYIVLD